MFVKYFVTICFILSTIRQKPIRINEKNVFNIYSHPLARIAFLGRTDAKNPHTLRIKPARIAYKQNIGEGLCAGVATTTQAATAQFFVTREGEFESDFERGVPRRESERAYVALTRVSVCG